MTKTLLLNILYRIARQYFDKDLFDRIRALVVALMSADLTGDEKRAEVRKAIFAEWKDVKTIVIDTIIQVILIKESTK